MVGLADKVSSAMGTMGATSIKSSRDNPVVYAVESVRSCVKKLEQDAAKVYGLASILHGLCPTPPAPTDSLLRAVEGTPNLREEATSLSLAVERLEAALFVLENGWT